MKRFLLSKSFLLVIINIFSFILISLILISFFLSKLPEQTINFIDNKFIKNFDVEFSIIESRGNTFYPAFKISDLKILKQDKLFLAADEISGSLDILNSLFLMRPKILSINIKSGTIFLNDSVLTDKDHLKINAELNINTVDHIDGYIHLVKENIMASVFLTSKNNTQKYLINIPSNAWLSNLPIELNDDLKNLRFSLNLMGDKKSSIWNSIGSLNIRELKSNFLKLKEINASFSGLYQDKSIFLSLRELNKPFVSKQNLILIDFEKSVARISDLYINRDFFDIDFLLNIQKIGLKNLTYIFKENDPFFSSRFESMDINDLYLKSINDLSGIILLNNDLTKFKLGGGQILLETYDDGFYKMDAIGTISYSNAINQLDSDILLSNSNEKLQLTMRNFSQEKYKLDLVTKDISSDLFVSLLPKNLTSLKNNLRSSLKVDSLSNLYLTIDNSFDDNSFNYLRGSIESDQFKYQLSDNQLIESVSFKLSLDNSDIAIILENGSFNSFPFKSIHSHIDTRSNILKYSSNHQITIDDLIESNNSLIELVQDQDASFPINSIGIINLTSSNNVNYANLKLEDIELKISSDLDIQKTRGNIFIDNFNNAYGYISAIGFNQDINGFVKAKNLNSNFSISIRSDIEIDMAALFPSSAFFSIDGKELSEIKLSYDLENGFKINIFNDLSSTEILSDIQFFNKPFEIQLPTHVEISNLATPNIKIHNDIFDTLIILNEGNIGGYFKSGDYFDKKVLSLKNDKEFQLFIDIPKLNFEDLSFNQINNQNTGSTLLIKDIEFHFDELLLFGNSFNSQSGKISLMGNSTELSLQGNDLNGTISFGDDGFTKIDLKDSKINYFSFPNRSGGDQYMKMRLLGENINIDGVKIKDLDIYILENRDVITIDNIKVVSKNINISPLNTDEKAYISYNKTSDLYKVKGIFEFNKPSKQIQDYLDYDFEYLKTDMNVEWISTKRLNNLQGKLSFLVKGLKLEQEISNSVLLKTLGIFNLKAFFSTLSEIDLSEENRGNLNIRRGEGSFIFMKDKARISDPLIIETNFAKMKWIGDIQKDRRNNLSDLDLFLEMRLTISDNLPWYAAFLGGFPAVAGGMVIGSIFEEGINEISTINYQVQGDINNPELLRLE